MIAADSDGFGETSVDKPGWDDVEGYDHISTGRLPESGRIVALLEEAHRKFGANRDGRISEVYPALARARSDLFGICLVGTRGDVAEVGDSGHEFSIMSVSKPFVFALVCQEIGPTLARSRIGVNGTGLPFNSLAAIERSSDGRTNPMVNSGAIATTSLAPGEDADAKWRAIQSGLSRFAGRDLQVDEEIYESARTTNFRNRAIAGLLQSCDRIYCDPDIATDLYTRQCCLKVTARDLAVMGATLADGGVNPVTRERVVDAAVCHYALATMATAGMYETSGDWLYDIGLPAKSGISGGIVAVSPGKGGLATFAPLLDDAGNSVKGRLVAKFLSERLGMDLLVSDPDRAPTSDGDGR